MTIEDTKTIAKVVDRRGRVLRIGKAHIVTKLSSDGKMLEYQTACGMGACTVVSKFRNLFILDPVGDDVEPCKRCLAKA